MGFVIFMALPFLGLAALFSIILLYKLIRGLKAIQAPWRYVAGLVGALLAASSILPPLYVGFWIAVTLCYLAAEACRSLLG